ncbi:MAG TPA: hypothetical protein VLS90_12010 [Thermodesulfobacteriota bacterium]|nr:hypothetical protein [Thermodesulfobacteriota bacterium]
MITDIQGHLIPGPFFQNPGFGVSLEEQCGLESVLLGTDAPFDMGLPDPVRFVRESVPRAEQDAIRE